MFSATRNVITKATEYVIFSFSFSYVGFSSSRRVWMLLSVSNMDFFNVLAAIIKESSDRLPYNLAARNAITKAK